VRKKHGCYDSFITYQRQLRDIKKYQEIEKEAYSAICAGTLPAYTKNELGHFGRELVKKLEAEQESNS
jgi:hypothetical protein